MAQFSVDSIDSLAEGLRSEYTQGQDGRYYLKVENLPDGWAIEDTSNLRKTVGEEREARKIAEKRLKKFERIEDPQAALQAMERMAELGDEPTLEAKIKAAREAVEAQLRQQYSQELETERTNTSRRTEQLQRLLVDNEALSALTKHNAFEPAQMLPIIRDGVAVIEEENELKVRVIDPATGQPAVTRQSGQSGYMTIEELVQTRKNGDLAFAFKGSGESGTGFSGGAGGSNNGTKIDQSLSPVEKLKAARRAQAGE